VQNLTIWGITAIATASVISGLNAGVKFLSLLAFILGMVLQFLVFTMDDSKFLMNLIVQEVGYFLQNSIFGLNWSAPPGWWSRCGRRRPYVVHGLLGCLLPGLVVCIMGAYALGFGRGPLFA
jgi:uncharacterized membrane protein YjjP (DUF1212 family)